MAQLLCNLSVIEWPRNSMSGLEDYVHLAEKKKQAQIWSHPYPEKGLNSGNGTQGPAPGLKSTGEMGRARAQVPRCVREGFPKQAAEKYTVVPRDGAQSRA